MPQGIAQGFIVAAEQVHEKHILPRASAHGARLDLAQTDVAQGEYAERFEQSSGNVLHGEGQRSLIRATSCSRLSPPDEKKTREVLLVILDAGLQNLSAINFGGPSAGNACRIAQTLGHDVLDAPRRVVKRYWLELRIFREQVAALIQRHGMREYAPDIAELRRRQSNQIVDNAQTKFAHD